jgi:hypothetical protein
MILTSNMIIKEKLRLLNLSLPPVTTPGGNYTSVNIRGAIAYIAIQFPIWGNEYRFQGVLGEDITTEEGYTAMQLCALNVLSQIDAKLGFESVVGLNHVEAFYQAKRGWDNAPKVVNGASDLFVQVMEEMGIHSRSILGVYNLPRNFCAGISCTVTIK